MNALEVPESQRIGTERGKRNDMKASRTITAREQGSISCAVINEVLRIALFLAYYMGLICLGVIILVVALGVAKILAFDYLPHLFTSWVALVLMISIIVGLPAFAAAFGIYLIKPLFSFTKNLNKKRVAVSRKDCPKLFALIENLSNRTGFRMPRHVYLTTDVNACVFYNTGFWSIFLPVRKNLEIGLGLFNSTSIQEVKAVLAHEFGHFGQSSMKVGSAVSITNTVLHNLIYTDDFYDRALNRWRSASWTAWRLFGIFVYGWISLLKRITYYFYLFVLRGDRKLSRLMEFEADEVACRLVGSDAFISAMCKIELITACDRMMLPPFLTSCLDDGQYPDNYFSAYEVVSDYVQREGGTPLKASVMLTKLDVVPSRVKIKDIWSSHPDLSDRLECARALSITVDDEEPEPAWSLIPDEVAKRVSDRFFEVITAPLEKKPERITSDEFRKRVDKLCATKVFPLKFASFFDRAFEKFDLQKAFGTDCAENPFSSEYSGQIAELNAARADMVTLEQIASGKIDVRSFTYNGIECTRETVPVEEHRSYLAGLTEVVAEKDAAVCSYLSHLGDEADQEYARSLYEKVAGVESIYAKVAERLAEYDGLINQCLTKSGKMRKGEYYRCCTRIVSMEKELHKGIDDFKAMFPDAISNDESGRMLLEYATRLHNSEVAYSPNSFQELQRYRNLFWSVCQGYHRRCHLSLAHFAQSKVKSQGQCVANVKEGLVL